MIVSNGYLSLYGICATAILVDALRKYGVNVGFYIPNRLNEGYGLHGKTVKLAHEKGYSLLITVDNGVKAFEALQIANELGIDVIVSDHHNIDGDVLCNLLLHPATLGRQFETLSGAGIALLMARSLVGDIKEHIVYACVAAIADVMVVKKETRSIIKLGIQYLKEGIAYPIWMLANDFNPIWDESLIAYQIVPKINATGRLADLANANNTVRYLLLEDRAQIQAFAKQIIQLNDQRKIMSDIMVETARSLVKEEYPFQLIFHESFHEGMTGLIAGKLQAELNKPVMVAATNKDSFKGSIRSGDFIDLTNFFDDCMPYLQGYGGHKGAAGIHFAIDDKQKIQDFVNEKMKNIVLEAHTNYDVIMLDVSDITKNDIQSLQLLAPFGEGFEEPLFYFANVKPISHKIMKQIHMKWEFAHGFEAVYFNCPRQLIQNNYQFYDFVGNLRINTFMKKSVISLSVLEASGN